MFNGTMMQWRHIPQFLEQEIFQLYKPLINIIGEYFGECSFEESIGVKSNNPYRRYCDFCETCGSSAVCFGCVRAGDGFTHSLINICSLCWPYCNGESMFMQDEGSKFIKWAVTNKFHCKTSLSDKMHFAFTNIDITRPIRMLYWYNASN